MYSKEWLDSLWPEWSLENALGEGAYGSVFKIRRQDIGGVYYAALKVISVPNSPEEISFLAETGMSREQIIQYYQRAASGLAREFFLLERLKGNTNIVAYEDHKIVVRNNGIGMDILIRMELLTTLYDYLAAHPYTEQDVCRIGIDICSALILCEKENIIHRDIKPGNLFISHYGDCKLGDFSLALRQLQDQKSASARGSLSFISPEIYNGRTYDHRTDIYSLGLVLYRLLNYGRAPFSPLPPEPVHPEDLDESNRNRLSGKPFPFPAAASKGMADVIMKACAYEPGRRFRSAQEMKSAMERCQAKHRPSLFLRPQEYLIPHPLRNEDRMEKTAPVLSQAASTKSSFLRLSPSPERGNCTDVSGNEDAADRMDIYFTSPGNL